MKILEALKLVEEGKGMMVIRNPVRRGQKAIEFVRFDLPKKEVEE